MADLVKPHLPTTQEIKKILEKARNQAIKDAEMLGMILDNSPFSLERVALPTPAEALLDVEDSREEQSQEQEVINNVNETYEQSSSQSFDELDHDEKITVNNLLACDSLNIKDYSSSDKGKRKTDIYLTLSLNNNKIVTVKKSTLCWLFTNTSGRLSSDRLLRVRGMSGQKKEKAKERKNTEQTDKQKSHEKKRKKKSERKSKEMEETDDSEDDSEDIEYCESDDDVNLDVSDNETIESFETTSKISIENEKYYVVYYETQWYIGRVLTTGDNRSTIKFLEKFMNEYRWPKKDDTQEVKNKFIFYGPLALKGTHPFTLARSDTINICKKYKFFKSFNLSSNK